MHRRGYDRSGSKQGVHGCTRGGGRFREGLPGSRRDVCPEMDAFELSKFASRHNVAFVACDNDIEEMNRLGIRERVLPRRGFRTITKYCESNWLHFDDGLLNCSDSFPPK